MTPETPLDAAFRAQEAEPDDPALRLRFHERVLDAELVLPLGAARTGPEIFDLAEGRFALAFDRDERMAAFLGAPAEFVALSGRRLVALLTGRGTGIALNLGAASATLLTAETVDWMAAIAGPLPEIDEARITSVAAPASAPAGLIEALGQKLAPMAGRIVAAHLVEAAFGTGRSGLLLALVAVAPDARPGIAAAIAETVRLAGPDAPAVDVTFLDPDGAEPSSRSHAPACVSSCRAGPPGQAVPEWTRRSPPRLRLPGQ